MTGYPKAQGASPASWVANGELVIKARINQAQIGQLENAGARIALV